MQDKLKKIVLTGGGTAGHVFPLLAVAEQLQKQGGFSLVFYGSYSGLEAGLVKNFGLPYQRILTGKFRRYLTLWNIWDLVKLIGGFFQSLWLLIYERPDLIFAKGGYVCLPVVLAGFILHIPIVSHESDVILGFSNKIVEHIAKKLFYGFLLKYYSKINLKKAIYTGIPQREDFLKFIVNPDLFKIRAANFFKFSPDLKTVLVFGGSQGAHKINQLILEILPQVLDKYQLIHLCGKLDFDQIAKEKRILPEKLQKRYFIAPFLQDEMILAYTLSNLVVCRAGANTLAEISSLHQAAVLIPLSSAAGNHQEKNAQIFKKENAAMVLYEDDLDSSMLLTEILKGIENMKLRNEITDNLTKFAMPYSAKIVAREIGKLLK